MRISDWSSDVCSSDLVGKFICIGLNYSDHAAETGNPIPSEPIIFMKATSAITGPDDDVIIPKDSVKTDWEVERSEEHTSELQSLMRISYAVFCLKKKTKKKQQR